MYALTGSPPIGNSDFHGILVDSGAAYSSSGNYLQYSKYCRLTGTTSLIDESKARTMRYGIGKEEYKGTAPVVFPIENLWMSFSIHIVNANILIILDIQDMDRLGIYILII